MTTFEATGVNGQISFDGSTVTITHKGFAGWMTQRGSGVKSIPVKSIAAVQLKPATSLVNGFVSFTIPGEVSKSSGRGHKSNAIDDENAVILRKAHMAAMQPVVEAIQAAINAPAGAAPAAPDLADQIRKLSELRDQGILSAEEFETKKADLLARI